jgi:hypothetical protein
VTIPAGKDADDVLASAGALIVAIAKDPAKLAKLLEAALPESLRALIAELAAAMANSTFVVADGETTYSPSVSPSASPAPGGKSPAPGNESPAPGPSPGGYYGAAKRRASRVRRF